MAFLFGQSENGESKVSKTLSVCIVILMLGTAAGGWAANKTLTDAAGRKIDVPEAVQRVICSGPGALRLLVYLQAQEAVVAVDDIEKRRPRFDARPYVMSNLQLKSLPMFGQFRGYDNPELILALNPQPQLIFKTYPTMGHDPIELQQKTGITVVMLNYGDLGDHRQDLYQALRIMGQCMNKEKRAEEVIDFFESSYQRLEGAHQRHSGIRASLVLRGRNRLQGASRIPVHRARLSAVWFYRGPERGFRSGDAGQGPAPQQCGQGKNRRVGTRISCSWTCPLCRWGTRQAHCTNSKQTRHTGI